MGTNNLLKVFFIILGDVSFLILLLLNGMAATGTGPFRDSIGNISARYETDITPANWTFIIWTAIYNWLGFMMIFVTVWVFRGFWALALFPYGFHICWVLSCVFNIVWLFFWEGELMLAGVFALIFIVAANLGALYFSCLVTDYYGMWLNMYHNISLICLRILVQNGLAVYSTWLSIASLINLSLVLNLWGVSKSTAATVSLCILFALVVAWFILENWFLDRWVRNIVTVYPLVIFALAGIFSKQYNHASPSPNSIFVVVQLALAIILAVSKICVTIWKNTWRPLFSLSSNKRAVSPLDCTPRLLL